MGLLTFFLSISYSHGSWGGSTQVAMLKDLTNNRKVSFPLESTTHVLHTRITDSARSLAVWVARRVSRQALLTCAQYSVGDFIGNILARLLFENVTAFVSNHLIGLTRLRDAEFLLSGVET